MIQNIMIIVRSHHSRVVQVHQSMDDFSKLQWAKVVDVIKTLSTEFYPNLTIKVEIAVVVDKDLIVRRIESLSDSLAKESTSKARLTRTDRLLEQTRARATILEDASNIEQQLTNH